MAMPGSTAWRVFQALLVGATAAVTLYWASLKLQGADAWFAMPAAWLALAAGAAIQWRLGKVPAGSLQWTGSQWLHQEGTGPATPIAAPAVMIDLDAWMLLRLTEATAARQVRWRALQRGADLAQWACFRAAVYSPASRPGPRSEVERPPP
jgi:hypothetical protein